MKRNIISIDESLCNGCGACVEGCHEGALQLIDGKARIVSELYCDGLGACIGECPVGAITVEEREALPYDERAVMERILPQGEATVVAHLRHLHDHGQRLYVDQALAYLNEKGVAFEFDFLHPKPIIDNPETIVSSDQPLPCGCPGSMARSFKAPAATGLKFSPSVVSDCLESELAQWPVQLHLLNPQAGYFHEADVVLAADCTAYAYADFHRRFIKNRTLAIACPKLDHDKEVYVSKLVDMIELAGINTLTVVIMEVPCCGGLLHLAKVAVERAQRKIPLKKVVIGVQGQIVEETWV
ncbi:MAG: ATP-binding protein [Bacteroides sp.]